MPQPLPRNRTIGFDFRSGAILERMMLAPYIGAIASHWTEIESRLGIFLAAVMGGEADTIVKVFLALQTDGGRKATLDTVTELKLSTVELLEFRDIQKHISARYAERNRAVHGAWGISDHYPNDLLWYDPRTSIAMFSELLAHAGPENKDARRKLIEKQNKNIRIYTEKDFKDVLKRFGSTYSKLQKFSDPYVKPLFERLR